MPKQGWYKYNTNRASKGNPRRSSWAYYLRDAQGDLVRAEGGVIDETDNMEVKERAILYATNHSKQVG